MAIEVRPIQLPRDARAFIDVWWTVYGKDPHWVPPLLFERLAFLDPKKNPYFEVSTLQCFIAYEDGRAVGTIAATKDHAFQAIEPGVGFFGFFEFVDRFEVAKALFDAAVEWHRAQGMKTVRGPFNFNTNHECGLLVEPFDSDPLVLMVWNPAYYVDVYARLGLVKAQDMYAYWMDNNGRTEQYDRIARLTERVESRAKGLTIRSVDVRKFEAELRHVHEVYLDAWEDNWGFVKMTDREFHKMAEGIKDMIDPHYCYMAFINGEIAAFSITLPDYNQVVKPMNGRIFPFGWWHYLTRRSKVDQMRVFTLGVKKKFRHMNLGLPLYKRTWEAGLARKVKGAEASWILESNRQMRDPLEKMGFRIYKTYRIFERPVDAATRP